MFRIQNKFFMLTIIMVLTTIFIYGCGEDQQKVNEEYVYDVVQIAYEATSAFEDISYVTGKSMSTWTEEDINLLYVALQTLQGLEAKADDIDPPDDFKEAHQEFVAACISYGRSSVLIESGLTAMDANMLNMALIHIEDGNNHMSAATSLLPKNEE